MSVPKCVCCVCVCCASAWGVTLGKAITGFHSCVPTVTLRGSSRRDEVWRNVSHLDSRHVSFTRRLHLHCSTCLWFQAATLLMLVKQALFQIHRSPPRVLLGSTCCSCGAARSELNHFYPQLKPTPPDIASTCWENDEELNCKSSRDAVIWQFNCIEVKKKLKFLK